MPAQPCRHIKTNGLRCQSPALEGKIYCYFHFRNLDRHSQYRLPSNAKDFRSAPLYIELHLLEDADSIQSALSKVINAIAIGSLDPRRGSIILRGLQIATNLTRISNVAKKNETSEIVTRLATTDDDLDYVPQTATEAPLEAATQTTPPTPCHPERAKRVEGPAVLPTPATLQISETEEPGPTATAQGERGPHRACAVGSEALGQRQNSDQEGLNARPIDLAASQPAPRNIAHCPHRPSEHQLQRDREWSYRDDNNPWYPEFNDKQLEKDAAKRQRMAMKKLRAMQRAPRPPL